MDRANVHLKIIYMWLPPGIVCIALHRQGSNRLRFPYFSSSCLDFEKQSKVKNKSNKKQPELDHKDILSEIT